MRQVIRKKSFITGIFPQVIKTMRIYSYNDSRVVDREIRWLILGESYWKEQTRREIDHAISEVRNNKHQADLETWVRKILWEQRRMKYGGSWPRGRYRKFPKRWIRGY